MINPDTYAKLSDSQRKAIDEMSGEFAARHFGKAWDTADATSTENMRKNGVKITAASASMVSDITVRIGKLERDWVAQAEAAGLSNAGQALREFRAEIAKQ